MATVQKTTVRRFNGVDWDSIYFSSAADVTVLGTSAKVVKDEVGFTFDDILEFNDTVSDLLIKLINRVATLDIEHIQKLEAGEGIEKLDVSKLDGIIDRKNLPKDVSGKCVEVESEDEKNALTADDLNVGDLVKVKDGKTYIVKNTEPDGSVEYTDLVDNASEIDWERITNTPDSAEGYGIENVDVTKINWSGVLPLKVIPKAAISELITVDAYEDIADLDAESVQLGDTIKIKDTFNEDGTIDVAGKMYYVVDDTKLGTEDWEEGLVEYTAGMASAVYWSGVLDTPTTLAGYGITDAVNKETFEKFVKEIMGGGDDEYIDPTVTDPDDPGYIGELVDAAAGDVVKWDNKYWIVLSNDGTNVNMILSTLGAVCDFDGIWDAHAEFVASMADTSKSRLGAGGVSISNMNEINGLNDLTVMYEGEKAGWFTRAEYINSRGGIRSPETADDDTDAVNKGIRPCVIVNITEYPEAPSKDPENPVYTEDLEDAEPGDTVTWNNANWLVVDKSDTEIVLVENETVRIYSGGKSSPFDKELLNIYLRDNAKLSGCWPLLKDNSVYVPTKAEALAYPGMADHMMFPPEPHSEPWWLRDAQVQNDGSILDYPDETTVSAKARIFLIVDLTHPDDVSVPPEASLADRVEAIEKMIGDANTEGTILNEIEKLKSGDTIKTLDWSKIINTPTTLAGYGITDAVSADDIIIDAILTDDLTAEDIAGKLVAIGEDGKLHVDITGDAHTIDGTTLDELVTEEEFAPWSLNIPVYLEKTDDFKDPRIGQMVMIPVGDPVEVDENGNPILPDEPETNTIDGAEQVDMSLWGINTGDIQSLTISEDGKTITGTSKYISWPDFSSDPEDQEGNYIVFKVNPVPADAVVKMTTKAGEKTLDEDMIIVWRLTEGKNVELTINGEAVTIDVSGVVCEPKEEPENP